MITRFFNKFSTTKYFMDDLYQNVSIQSPDNFGSLSSICNQFSELNINITYVKSHYTSTWTKSKKFLLDISIEKQSQEKLAELKSCIEKTGKIFKIEEPIKVPWFPRKVKDLDLIGKTLLDVKDVVNKDHLQFTDNEYRNRRDFITSVTANYKMGTRIPNIEYDKNEVELWKMVYQKLRILHKKSMSKRFEAQIQNLEKEFNFTQRIPQLDELNDYLKQKTGFQIKPTHGILSQREFLNCFAFRVFCCTQYLRNTKTPDYTPEPDIIHEIVGHIPMFADPDVAELSQQIGLLSLGATDEQISHLGSLYWFTLEFGACREGDHVLGYGAGIASSISEIENLLSNSVKFEPFAPFVNYEESYPIQTVQECYKVTETFEKSLSDMSEYGRSITKPVATTYNYNTRTIEYDRNIVGVDVGDKPIEFV